MLANNMMLLGQGQATSLTFAFPLEIQSSLGAWCISNRFSSELRNPKFRKLQFFFFFYHGLYENLINLYLEGRHYLHYTGQSTNWPSAHKENVTFILEKLNNTKHSWKDSEQNCNKYWKLWLLSPHVVSEWVSKWNSQS